MDLYCKQSSLRQSATGTTGQVVWYRKQVRYSRESELVVNGRGGVSTRLSDIAWFQCQLLEDTY